MRDFASKVIIVTGASSGIGASAAREFAKLGASLVITGRNVDNLNAVAEDCKLMGAKDILTVSANFENLSEVENIVDRAIEKFGKLDVLINNVGVFKTGNLQDAKMEDFDWIFQVNVRSVIYLTKLAMPYLVESRGNVVNVSSIWGIKHSPVALIFCMSNAALDQFTRTISLEYASKGVRVNSVNPSVVWTNIVRHQGWSKEQTEKYYSASANSHPLGRIGTVEDVANAIVFLASDESSWTTGQCFLMDGGRSLTIT